MSSDENVFSTECVYDNRWLKMMRTTLRSGENYRRYFWASRHGRTTPRVDAVVIAAIHTDAEGHRRAVVTDEYRVPLYGREVGFPAGLCEGGSLSEDVARELHEETNLTVTKVHEELTTQMLISSAGMSNEAVRVVFVECEGEPSSKNQEPWEDINVRLLDLDGVREILAELPENHYLSAKAWAVLNSYVLLGEIAFGVCLGSKR